MMSKTSFYPHFLTSQAVVDGLLSNPKKKKKKFTILPPSFLPYFLFLFMFERLSTCNRTVMTEPLIFYSYF